MAFIIHGVHPVAAPEPCDLIEAEVDDDDFDWGQVTQEVPGQPQSNWQAPWDEQPLEAANRWAFFFHYLDTSKPLVTPHGPTAIPEPTPVPDRLATIEYEAP